MAYVKMSDVKPGDTLIADDGFTCVSAGPVEIQADEYGKMFFACESGRHYIDGQKDCNDELVGLTRPERENV